MRNVFILTLMISILLSSCGTLEISIDRSENESPAGFQPDPASTPEPLSMESTSAEIQQVMLASATKWETIFLDGIVTWFDQTGASQPPQVFHQQIWIDQMGFRFRYLNGQVDGEADFYRSSDGFNVFEMNLASGESSSNPLPNFVILNPQFVPTLSPDTAYLQPLWGQMGSPLGELAYSSDFAQSEGSFVPVAIEMIAGRQALVVDWTQAENSQPSFRHWLDMETAVILKQQSFGKGGGSEVAVELVVNEVVFDAFLPDSLFGLPSSTPRFSDINGDPSVEPETGPAVPAGEDPAGDLYFFTLPHQAGENVRLVRLPGSCVLGAAPCPPPDPVNAPFPFVFNLTALSWSPDGKLAVFAYSDNPNGTPTKLWLYELQTGSWDSLAEFPYIDPPFWSPDGTWIAFRQQDGKGGEDVYVVHRDGTGLKNLTSSEKLPLVGRPYVMDGWLTENIIVRSALPGKEGSIYLVRAGDGAVRPMFDALLTKGVFFPSNDGAFLAFDNYDNESQKHKLQMTEPDGANPVDLATFSGGSMYPIVWSPNNDRIAFVHYSSFNSGELTADAYVVGRDGRNLTQVYKGVTVGRLVFSPDGKFLLVEETTSPTGGHLFIVNLSTLEARILQAPGLLLDTDWYAPSWSP